MPQRLTPEMIECADALGLGHSTVSMRLHRGWDLWSAVCTLARDRSPNGNRQAKWGRTGRPRTMWELKRGFTNSFVRRREVEAAVRYLRERGLIPDDVIIPVERPRRSPLPTPRIRKHPTDDIDRSEYHRDFD
jgi:hypothetical protein